jgi:hypothetical protein
MSVMKLYYSPGACSLAPHIVLEETGDRFELSRVDIAADQQNSPEYLRINPNARVPALTDGNWVLPKRRRFCATSPHGIRPLAFGRGTRAKKRAAPNGSIGFHRPFNRPSSMSGAPRVMRQTRAQSRTSPQPARKTPMSYGGKSMRKSVKVPGRSASVTASPIRCLLFIGFGAAAGARL